MGINVAVEEIFNFFESGVDNVSRHDILDILEMVRDDGYRDGYSDGQMGEDL